MQKQNNNNINLSSIGREHYYFKLHLHYNMNSKNILDHEQSNHKLCYHLCKCTYFVPVTYEPLFYGYEKKKEKVSLTNIYRVFQRRQARKHVNGKRVVIMCDNLGAEVT